MRPNQQQNSKNRSRGRNNNGGRKHINPLSRSFESNGPDVKVRGNAAHIAEKYLQLARDAQSSGDGVMAENYLQHAEHYFRIVAAAQPQGVQRSDQVGQGNDEEDDDDFPPMNDRFASPEPPASRAPAQAEQQPGNSDEAVAEARPAETTAAATEEQPAAGEGEPRRQRERRRRRSGRGRSRRRAAAGCRRTAGLPYSWRYDDRRGVILRPIESLQGRARCPAFFCLQRPCVRFTLLFSNTLPISLGRPESAA
jgi:hypothetical protein